MEVNRDEAKRCVEIAVAALKNKQADKAVRFLEKAQRLFPTDDAKGKATRPFCYSCQAWPQSHGLMLCEILGRNPRLPDIENSFICELGSQTPFQMRGM